MEVVFHQKKPGDEEYVVTDLDMEWPRGVYSLSHVALPFPVDDPLYGADPGKRMPSVISIGDVALRGEKGKLRIPAAEMLRMRWNPFYPFLEETALQFLNLEAVSGQNVLRQNSQ